MKRTLLIVALLPFVAGCASYTTKQVDNSSLDKYGIEVRTITTTVKARTFFDSNSALTAFRATTTDKTQSTAVGTLNQSADGTNAVKLAEAIAEGVSAGLKKSILPLP